MSDDDKTMILGIAREYVSRGFSVIPIRYKSKLPMITWSEYKQRRPTDDELCSWFGGDEKNNIAIVCGHISGIFCIDCDGPEGSRWAARHLPPTGVYSITCKGYHALYRIPDGVTIKNKVRLVDEVDIRAEGGYFVAPPSVHENGHTYRWQFAMNGWDSIPILNIADLKSDIKKTYSTGNLNLDLTDIKDYLSTEPLEGTGDRNDTLARLAGRWFGKGLDYDDVLTLALEWNKKNTDPLPEGEVRTTLRSINSKERTKQKNSGAEILSPAECMHPDTGPPVPPEILRPGGILQELMTFIDVNSPVSIPYFSLGAALTFLGSIAGQKFQTETGLRTNIYCIALGYSGTGKNAPFSTMPQLLQNTEAAPILGPTELTSGAAILRWLSEPANRVAVITTDEIGLLMKGIQKEQSSVADIPRLLIKMFSSTDRPEIKNYASGEKIIVPWHHLSMYGASSPDRFWNALTNNEVADGFLARILLFESRHDAPFPKCNIAFKTSPSLEHDINRIYTFMPEGSGNLSPHMGGAPTPKIIPRTKEANEMFRSWALKYHLKKNENKTDAISSIYGRAAEHAAKLALLHSLSYESTQIRSVEPDSVKWACMTVDYIISSMVEQINDNIAENATARNKKKVLRYVKARQQDGVNKRTIQRYPCQGLTAKGVTDLLESLLLSGELTLQTVKTNRGREQERFFIAKERD